MLVEAQAAGTPVIAFGQGGALETIRGLDSANPTGVLFREQTAQSVVEAIHTFERECQRIKPAECRDNAMRFGIDRFHREFLDHAKSQWKLFSDSSQRPHLSELELPAADTASESLRAA